MAALDFPASPTVGQQYAAPNGVTYQWDGAAWVVTGGPPATPSGPAGGDLSGTYPNPSVTAAAKSKWTTGTTTIAPTDATKNVAVPGPAAGATVVLGSPTIKSRLFGSNTAGMAGLTVNRDPVAGTQDDGTKTSWQCLLRADTDQFAVQHYPTGGGSGTNFLTLDNNASLSLGGDPATGGTSTVSVNGNASSVAEPAMRLYKTRSGGSVLSGDYVGSYSAYPAYAASTYGRTGTMIFQATENHTASAGGTSFFVWNCPNGSRSQTSILTFDQAGNLTITGATGTKASGTTWANPSDPRLKDDVTPYPYGLADICRLEPISYTLNGLAGTPAGMRACGFDAEAVRAIFPDCVTSTRGKLHPDDDEETEILALDIHGILVALVNAMKELAATHA